MYDTEKIPMIDRVDYVRDAARRQPMPIELIASPDIVIQADMHAGDFGRASIINLRSVSSGPMQMRRTPRLIRRSDPEANRFVFCVEGMMRYHRDDRQMMFGPRLVGVLGTSEPFCWDRYEARPTLCRLIMVTLPRHILAVPPRLQCTPISGAKRLRTAIARLLIALTDRPEIFRQMDDDISDFLITALDALLAAQCGKTVPTDLSPKAMMFQVHATILELLKDPSLRPKDIAEAMNIDKRTLHNITAAHGTTVMETVRHHRIERIHRDIIDPTMFGDPFIEIGQRWGFSQPSQLTHAIKRKYGHTPTELRRRSQASEQS